MHRRLLVVLLMLPLGRFDRLTPSLRRFGRLRLEACAIVHRQLWALAGSIELLGLLTLRKRVEIGRLSIAAVLWLATRLLRAGPLGKCAHAPRVLRLLCLKQLRSAHVRILLLLGG